MLLNHQRRLTGGFLQLQSHYLLKEHFCNVRRGNENGVAESMVRYTRSNFMVPVPEARNLKELNHKIEARCIVAPVKNVFGKTIASVVITASTSTFTKRKIRAMAGYRKQIAQNLRPGSLRL